MPVKFRSEMKCSSSYRVRPAALANEVSIDVRSGSRFASPSEAHIKFRQPGEVVASAIMPSFMIIDLLRRPRVGTAAYFGSYNI